MPESTLDEIFHRLIDLLDRSKTQYLVIGGLAVGVIGEARSTQDIDVILFLSPEKLFSFLEDARGSEFVVDAASIQEQVRNQGAFKMSYKNFWVDVILASTDLEEEALQRAQKIVILGREVLFPSPEDLILFKLVPGRDKDILDVKGIIKRWGDKLARGYLDKWAMKLCDRAENMRVWNQLQGLLEEEGI